MASSRLHACKVGGPGLYLVRGAAFIVTNRGKDRIALVVVSYKVPVPAAAGSVPRKYGYLSHLTTIAGAVYAGEPAPATTLLSNPPTKGFGHCGMWGLGSLAGPWPRSSGVAAWVGGVVLGAA